MEYGFILSKEDLFMAESEVRSLANYKTIKLYGNLLIADMQEKEIEFLCKRLALSRAIFKVLFSCNENGILDNVSRYPWNSIYNKSYCVRIQGKTSMTEKDLAGYIWRVLNKPKVDLTNPRTPIYFFFYEGRVHACIFLKQIRQDYFMRKAHNRPEHHPISLHPRLARALVNLTGVRKGELVDLFCGTGGIILEAGLMGLRPTGYDIDQIMLNKARINLEHFGVRIYKLIKKDALKIKKRINYIASDMPYGKNTKQKEPGVLYNGFLCHLREILGKRAVIVFPILSKRNFDYERMIKGSKLRIKNSFTVYIHKSMSKQIFVLE